MPTSDQLELLNEAACSQLEHAEESNEPDEKRSRIACRLEGHRECDLFRGRSSMVGYRGSKKAKAEDDSE
jgi:hypothetical protein